MSTDATRHRSRAAAAGLTAAILFCLAATPAWAAEPAGWRPVYDLVMRWVNFAILFGLLFHFGRRPLANLLRGEAERHQQQIQAMEGRKAEVLERLAEIQRMRTENEARFDKITEQLVAMGERRREEIIDDARRESELLLAGARRRAAHAVRAAHARLRDDMVDRAVELALARLPREVTAADNDRCLDRFYQDIHKVG